MEAKSWIVFKVFIISVAAGPIVDEEPSEPSWLPDPSKVLVEKLAYLPALSHNLSDWSESGNKLVHVSEVRPDTLEPTNQIQIDYSRDRYAWNPDFTLYHPPDLYLNTSDSFPRALRGRPSSFPYLYSGEYVAAIGAAQVYGTLAERPFTTILQDDYLKQPVINLAKGGPGSYYYATEYWSTYAHLLRNASTVIVQIMSGRSACSSLPYVTKDWGCTGLNTYHHRESGIEREAHQIIKDFYHAGDEKKAVELCQDLREQGILQYFKLFDQIKENNPINPRIILNYVSRRAITDMDDETYFGCLKFMEGSPVLVDRKYLKRLVSHSAVEGIVIDTEDYDLKCKLVMCSPITEKVRRRYPTAVREAHMLNRCRDTLLVEFQAHGARFCRPDELRKDVSKGAPCYDKVRLLTTQ